MVQLAVPIAIRVTRFGYRLLLMLRAPLKGVMHVTVILIHDRLVDLLILDVFSYLRFVQPHSTDIVPVCPKTMTFEVPLVLTVSLKHNHRALSLYIPHERRIQLNFLDKCYVKILSLWHHHQVIAPS